MNWDRFDIQEHDEMMAELSTCTDGELVALLEDEDECCEETHDFALAGVHPEEIQTEIDRRLELTVGPKCPVCLGFGFAGGCSLCGEPL
jgi:hypothetical protein